MDLVISRRTGLLHRTSDLPDGKHGSNKGAVIYALNGEQKFGWDRSDPQIAYDYRYIIRLHKAHKRSTSTNAPLLLT